MLRRATTLFRTNAVQRVTERESGSSRGQVLVLFALMLTVLIGMTAFVVDLAWIWSHQLKVQRAADAGALAGVVWLPGNEPSAQDAAEEAATANGYTDGVEGVTVDAREDPTNDNRIVVDISAPVETFFMQLFGVDTVTVARTARAEYVQPVPMGSPENYYGVFGQVRTPAGGTWTHVPGDDSGWLIPTIASGSNWGTPNNIFTSNDSWAVGTSNDYLTARGFTFSIPTDKRIAGIEVGIEASRTGTGTPTTGCRLDVSLTGDDADDWTSMQQTVPLGSTDPAAPYHVVGSSSATWGTDDHRWGDNWDKDDLDDGDFRVRMRNNSSSGQCASSIDIRVDQVRVRFHWATFEEDADLAGPYGGPGLEPRGFWGTMLAQGSIDVNGDAYSPRYETRTNQLNPDYLPAKYYDYAVEMAPGSSNGEVWVYDPGFCAVGAQYGTGDRFLETTNAISAFYTLWDTRGTLFDTTDDTRADPLGDDNLFRQMRASDTTLGGPGGYTSCTKDASTNLDTLNGRYWHNRWWLLASGLQGGTIYRVRTSSTDPNSPSDQLNAGGQNSFAIWGTAAGEAPDIYGIGAMEAYTPLEGGTAAQFYLAQIDAIHAGKTVRIELWDPGDTQSLPATLSILIPTASGYTATTFDWTAAEGSANNSANCLQSSGAGVTSVMATSSGGVQQFQGCWVTIEIPIPDNYTAPTPPGEPEGGWWKINYGMGGSSSTSAYDLTTWQVEIRGNPVHLVVP